MLYSIDVILLMEKHILLKSFLISPSAVVRMMYAWCMKFFLTVGSILGWTITLSIALTNYSLKSLPFILMANAVFSVVGMMLFSVLITYISSRKLIIITTLISICSILTASFFYHNKIALLVFVLIASGLCLTQVAILLSNYIEDYFSPSEAERLFPKIDSSETLGGIIGGLMLVVLGFASMSYKLLWLWAIFTAAFLFVFIVINPELPVYLEKLKKKNDEFRNKIRFNGLVQGINEIKRTPFLQLLLYVSLINWIIALLIEFQFAKAVSDSIPHHGSLIDHEIALTYGLGSLQILFHSSALVVELFATSRLLRIVGTLGGFLLHAVLMLISSFAVLLSFGYVTAILLRNNYEASSIIHKTSYETSYYAFKFGARKPIREIFEGLFMPIGAIIGTLILIGVEIFFLEEHFIYPINIFLMFLVVSMVFIAFQLKDKYADLARKNLESKNPMEQFHAIEVLGQMGHEEAVECLYKAFKETRSQKVKLNLIKAITSKGNEDTIGFLSSVVKVEKDERVRTLALEYLESKIRKNGIRNLDPDLKQKICIMIEKMIRSGCSYYVFLAANILTILGESDSPKAVSTSYSKNLFFQYFNNKFENGRDEMSRIIGKLIRNNETLLLAEIARSDRSQRIKKYFEKMTKSNDNMERLYAYYGLINMHNYKSATVFINLLLFCNNVVFKKAVVLLENVDRHCKIELRNSMHLAMGIHGIKNNITEKKVINRLSQLYKLTET